MVSIASPNRRHRLGLFFILVVDGFRLLSETIRLTGRTDCPGNIKLGPQEFASGRKVTRIAVRL